MLNGGIRAEFNRRKCCGERNIKSQDEKYSKDNATIEYMRYLLDSNTFSDFKDKCFCFWNISDCYAMLRDSEREYENHRKFADYVSSGNTQYSFWTVCDATQRFTLTLGGYGEFWQKLYRNAAEKSLVTDENYRIAYEAHRAAMAVHPALEISEGFTRYADMMFGKFLDSNKEREEYEFYRLLYLSSSMKAFGRADIDIESLCLNFYNYLSCEDTECEFVLGEWEFLNRERSKRNLAVVGITAVINALIDIGESQRGRELYRDAIRYGLPQNAYIEKRL